VAVALIGPRIDASHNYERTHTDALLATTRCVLAMFAFLCLIGCISAVYFSLNTGSNHSIFPGINPLLPKTLSAVSSQKVGVLGVFGGLRPPKTPNLPHLIEMILSAFLLVRRS
jgi:hypothetical protein